ncbi:MAG TPA: segregation/condensation protein A [Ruminiclostridium sp.]|nr:segregation/condensation protein A [Ruminiclostridium sp.]
MEKLSFKIPIFEGPLDALLYLISKNKLDIYDVPITELLTQYMDYLKSMSEMDLDITSDFLEMASRLVEIKSSMLLPKPDESKKEELIATLIGYKTCKAMAQALRQRDMFADIFVREPIKIDYDETYKCRHDADVLKKAYLALGNRIKSRRPPTTEAFRGVVGRKIVSVASRIIHVIKRLVKEGKKGFYSMFDDASERSEAVATFLAMLELVKSKKIIIEDDEIKTVSVRRQ